MRFEQLFEHRKQLDEERCRVDVIVVSEDRAERDG
jgi:hypothetical protein